MISKRAQTRSRTETYAIKMMGIRLSVRSQRDGQNNAKEWQGITHARIVVLIRDSQLALSAEHLSSVFAKGDATGCYCGILLASVASRYKSL